MKKKCLGCSKVYEAEISICEDCFKEIETVRNQFDILAIQFRKRPYLVVRKYFIWLAALNLLLLLLKFLIQGDDFLKLIIKVKIYTITYFLPIAILLISGILLGKFLSKRASKRIVKMWSDKEWYSVSRFSRRYLKYWLPEIIPLFALGILAWLIYYIKPAVLSLELTQTTTLLFIFYIGIYIGITFFTYALLLGLAIGIHNYQNWIPKLSK